jgi:hypothetical protein
MYGFSLYLRSGRIAQERNRVSSWESLALRSLRSTIRSRKPCSSTNSLVWKPWQVAPDGLAHHARAGKGHQGLGLGDVQVAQHGEAGGHPPGGGVGEHADVGQLLLGQQGQLGAGLGHLHQAEAGFHHAGTAAFADDDQRALAPHGHIGGRAIFSPTTLPMLPPMKLKSMQAITTCCLSSLPSAARSASFRPVSLRVLAQTVGVLLGVHELQRVARHQVGPDLLVLAVIEQQGEVLLAADLLVVLALVADPQVVGMVARRSRSPSTPDTCTRALQGSPFSLRWTGGDAFLDACEPAHVEHKFGSGKRNTEIPRG